MTAARRSIGSVRWWTEARTATSPPPQHAPRFCSKLFGDRVGLVHGRMKGRDKDAAMEAFASGDTQILVATTVIEVGVDVPEATIMVIEHAERFGLAQLHQLRGRVGRGDEKSSCILLYAGAAWRNRAGPGWKFCARPKTGSASRKKICACAARAKFWASAIGRAGLSHRTARPPRRPFALCARRRRETVAEDPELRGERGTKIQLLLYLFERDTALNLLRAG